MGTYTQILYQIVFSTKNREPTLDIENHKEVFQYIWGLLKNKNCILYQIGGVADHLHIILHLHPSIALSDLVKDIKIASAIHIKKGQIFPFFDGWQEGYGAFTYSITEKDNLIKYVKNQSEHHKKISFKDEFLTILKEHGITFDEKYLG